MCAFGTRPVGRLRPILGQAQKVDEEILQAGKTQPFAAGRVLYRKTPIAFFGLTPEPYKAKVGVRWARHQLSLPCKIFMYAACVIREQCQQNSA